ncbi:hypothetical protein QQF64_008548 [Cirrhinus molitorella]|uniref:Peptidase A9 domain-containing protein n=1 Tax=Cirrhinus molitorella TaxID=172907 RepID=A0ABR3M6G4_9TELE
MSAYHHLIKSIMSDHLHLIKIVMPACLHIMQLNMPAILLFVVTNVSARPHLIVIVMAVEHLIFEIITCHMLPIIRIVMRPNGPPTSFLVRDLLLTIYPHLVIIMSVLLMRMLIFRETAGSRPGEFHSLVTQPNEEFTILEPIVAQIQTQMDSSPKPKVDLSQSTLTREEQNQLESLISKYSDVFGADDYDYGRTDLVKHTIRTGDAQPIRQRAYRTSPCIRAEIDRQVQQLLSHDVIEESCSPWASPVVLVKNRDGSYRFCIDSRKLNAVTVKDSYPYLVPQML